MQSASPSYYYGAKTPTSRGGKRKMAPRRKKPSSRGSKKRSGSAATRRSSKTKTRSRSATGRGASGAPGLAGKYVKIGGAVVSASLLAGILGCHLKYGGSTATTNVPGPCKTILTYTKPTANMVRKQAHRARVYAGTQTGRVMNYFGLRNKDVKFDPNTMSRKYNPYMPKYSNMS